MEHIFKKGDKVFCILYGHGTVLSIDPSDSYPIVVLFESGDEEVYTINGCYDNNITPTLSFTEYTLEGFSQDRPEELPKKGDIVWGKYIDDDDWDIGHFYLLDKDSRGLRYCISSNPTGGKTLWVQQITTTNPYANEQ